MPSLQELITYWEERSREHPPIPTITWDDALLATIFYLNELKQVKTMLKDLAGDQSQVKAMAAKAVLTPYKESLNR